MQVSKKLESFLQGTKKLYINGEFVASASNKTFETPNPATGETLATLYEAIVNELMFVKQTSFEILVCLRVSCLGAGLSFDLVIARMKEGYISDFGTIHHHQDNSPEDRPKFQRRFV